MANALDCERCGAELPPEAAHGPVQCAYCGSTSVPAPRVVERVVERVVVVQGDGRAARVGSVATLPGVPCPRCGNTFDEAHAASHTVRGCRTCGGVFLETATVTALERARDEQILSAVSRFTRLLMPYARDERARLTCPFCQKALLRLDLGETGHSIDRCDTHGSFFDRGEVTVFAEFCRERRAGDLSDEDLENAGIPR